MKDLRVIARLAENGCQLEGSLPWASNLRKAGFMFEAAVAWTDNKPAAIVALDSQSSVIKRSGDLDLLGLRRVIACSDPDRPFGRARQLGGTLGKLLSR